MASSPKRKKTLQINVSPTVAIICSLIFGASYFGAEVYQHHNSYHDIDGIWKACFTPNKRCQQLIIQNINEAQESIHLMAYSFTDTDIADALVEARQRNVDVKVILDHSNLKANNPLLKELVEKKIDVRIDKPQGLAHSKVCVTDGRIVLTGSYNFSAAAFKKNAENLLVIHDKTVAEQYIANWQNRWDRSLKPSPADLIKRQQ
ncbi:phospholipase D family protein [Candidatus Paracaedibacter symbiosus]|uniref:phospholipase D family nuclease n=1 Tax=Candidatus Paracaedibacter symbiosus TaxID=244582 RepID=UPI001E4D7E86|nr:phospholipase D family protein [Candidatus Paracaedibacter symbiosus]